MKINYPIREVLDILRKNRDAHIAELSEVLPEWSQRVHRALDKLAEAVDRHGLEANNLELATLFYQKPKDVRYQYAKYIGMLERAEKNGEQTIAIDDDEYDQLFNDNWEWSKQAKSSNASYKVT